jgi:hypothetical protein
MKCKSCVWAYLRICIISITIIIIIIIIVSADVPYSELPLVLIFFKMICGIM